jgi:hypothetical protein
LKIVNKKKLIISGLGLLTPNEKQNNPGLNKTFRSVLNNTTERSMTSYHPKLD